MKTMDYKIFCYTVDIVVEKTPLYGPYTLLVADDQTRMSKVYTVWLERKALGAVCQMETYY